MKKITTSFLLLFYTIITSAQQNKLSPDSAAVYFEDIKTETKKHQNLWNKDLYGPILLVDPQTRELIANFADTAGVLKPQGKIFTGMLPTEMNVANTSVTWNGRDWAMIMLPLPSTYHDRINLFAHELFHVAQPSLQLKFMNVDNNHLDKKDGRVYLRLELEALIKTVQATNERDINNHLTNALSFRMYRQSLFSGSDTTENLLELNEGLAEYTGTVISNRTTAVAKQHFENDIRGFFSNPTFVRSFAYHTTPVYGYLLSKYKGNWIKQVSNRTNLTAFFINEFGISLSGDLMKFVSDISEDYNGTKIISEENEREEKTNKLIADYIDKFVTQPHFEITFEQMQVSFDPGNIMPLNEHGTVYPNMRIVDKWGILTVSNGALMAPNWDRIVVTIPKNSGTKKLNGDGWTLELNDGYSVIKNSNTGNFELEKIK
nr:hypothetical protein [Bacteroidota bacterium]